MAAPLTAAIAAAAVAAVPVDYASLRPYLDRVSSAHFMNLEKYASGDKNPLSKYSAEELKAFYADLARATEETFKDAVIGSSFVLTAGGPSAGKSTIFEEMIYGEEAPYAGYAYVDPDRASLFTYMTTTYKASIKAGVDPTTAYNHWREASICMCDLLLAIALNEGYNVAFGTTMTTPFAPKVLGNIRDVYHRSISMLHFTSPEEVRVATENKRREGGIVQCTDKDLIDKGNMLFDRLREFLDMVPNISFYFRGGVDEKPILAAQWQNRRMTVIDSDAFAKIKAEHNLRKGAGDFEAAVAALSAPVEERAS